MHFTFFSQEAITSLRCYE